MSTAPSMYVGNQFKTATVERNPLMSDVLSDCLNRITIAANANSDFSAMKTIIQNTQTAWHNGMAALSNAEALQLSLTPAVEQKLASLTHKPDMDTNSPLESWDNTIRAVAPTGSSLYIYLLPHGRETLTGGSINERISALENLAARLAEQESYPTLITLSSAEVGPFATEAASLRSQQGEAMALVESLREDQEDLRLASAIELYGMVGLGMQVYKATPEAVDELFDVNLLRSPAQTIPSAPIDSAWDALTRTLSTTIMPVGATRLVVFRQGEGGAPEELVTGDADQLAVTIPSMYTFDPGENYDLWLVGKNGKGMGARGPVITWMAD